MDRLHKDGAELVYRCAKQHSEPGSDKRGAKADELHLTPLELIACIKEVFPLLCPKCDAQMGDGAQIEPADWDLTAQPAPDFVVDQRINW